MGKGVEEDTRCWLSAGEDRGRRTSHAPLPCHSSVENPAMTSPCFTEGPKHHQDLPCSPLTSHLPSSVISHTDVLPRIIFPPLPSALSKTPSHSPFTWVTLF